MILWLDVKTVHFTENEYFQSTLCDSSKNDLFEKAGNLTKPFNPLCVIPTTSIYTRNNEFINFQSTLCDSPSGMQFKLQLLKSTFNPLFVIHLKCAICGEKEVKAFNPLFVIHYFTVKTIIERFYIKLSIHFL